MNWTIIVSHHVANLLSYYHAGWDYPESARRDRENERRTKEAWWRCRDALREQGIYDEFMKAGQYLI